MDYDEDHDTYEPDMTTDYETGETYFRNWKGQKVYVESEDGEEA